MHERPTRRNARILIVDDHADNVIILRDRLQARGYTTIEAHDGEEALRSRSARPGRPPARGHATARISFCSTSCSRELDGFEVARRIKSRPIPALHPDHHSDRARHDRGHGRRSRRRGRRLHHQADQLRRAGSADPLAPSHQVAAGAGRAPEGRVVGDQRSAGAHRPHRWLDGHRQPPAAGRAPRRGVRALASASTSHSPA